MLVTNLAEPEWISIKCHERIIGDIMCMVPRNVDITANILLNADLIVFKNPCVFITGKCYSFSWGFVNDTSVSWSHKVKNEQIYTCCNGIPCDSH